MVIALFVFDEYIWAILIVYNVTVMITVRHSIVASIPACHAGDRGSIPRVGDTFCEQRQGNDGGLGAVSFDASFPIPHRKMVATPYCRL